jgi:uncharacterized membrane protein YphA (DoxX/SURF4 family)
MTVYHIFGYVGIAATLLTILRYFTARPSNLLICFLQNFVGSLFIFSGFVKAVDPLGTSYKMHDYFTAFAAEKFFENAKYLALYGNFWDWVGSFSTPMAIFMIAAELFFGFMLLIGWKPKFTVAVIWALTIFFTFLTGYTYLSGYSLTNAFMLMSAAVMVIFVAMGFQKTDAQKGKWALLSLALLVVLIAFFSSHASTHPFDEGKMKVTDCGCFGDFIKLKPWETFWKDVILDFMIVLLVLNTKHIKPLFEGKRSGIAALSGVVSLGLCLYCVYWSEPIIDFRPYKIGNDVRDLRKVKQEPKVEMLFIYKNKATGAEKEFSVSDLSSLNYSEWDYKDRKDKVLDPGIPAKITNLFIENDEGAQMADSILDNPDYSLMVVAYNLKKTHEPAFEKLNAIAAGCDKAGIKFFAVTVNDGHIDEFRHRLQTAYPFYHADETPLKTIIRANPGLVLLKNGVVINKWHYRGLPDFESLNEQYFSKK